VFERKTLRITIHAPEAPGDCNTSDCGCSYCSGGCSDCTKTCRGPDSAGFLVPGEDRIHVELDVKAIRKLLGG
jgi:hypothetical protein